MSTKREIIYIFDIHAIIYRYHFACKDYLDENGNPNGGIYGVLYNMVALLKKNERINIIWAFDGASKNFRKNLLPEYKTHRGKMKEEIINQVIKIMKHGEEMQIPCLKHDEYEADDIIASVVENYKEIYDICIICNDKDLFQLVEDNKVYIWNFAKRIKINEEEVIKQLGVPANRVVDYLCMLGDASDGINGIDKIGKVTASKLIAKYNTIEDIILAESHIYDFSSIELSKKLVNLIKNINIIYEYKTLKMVDFMNYFTEKEKIIMEKIR